MCIHRLAIVSERVPQREDAMRRVEEIVTPQHVGDLHVDVVDGVRQEEHRRTVRADDHEIGDRRPLDRNFPAHDIDKRAPTRVGSAEPHRTRLALGDERRSRE